MEPIFDILLFPNTQEINIHTLYQNQSKNSSLVRGAESIENLISNSALVAASKCRIVEKDTTFNEVQVN